MRPCGPEKECDACGKLRPVVSFIVGIDIGLRGVWAARFDASCAQCRHAAQRRVAGTAKRKRKRKELEKA